MKKWLLRDSPDATVSTADGGALAVSGLTAAQIGALPAYLPPQKVTRARVLRSEWTKLRTQPSALWALLSP